MDIQAKVSAAKVSVCQDGVGWDLQASAAAGSSACLARAYMCTRENPSCSVCGVALNQSTHIRLAYTHRVSVSPSLYLYICSAVVSIHVLCYRFWVLSARLNQNFHAWILTPQETTKARQHNVYSVMFVVTQPLPDCMNVYLPLSSNGGDKAMCQRAYEALAAQSVPGAPERRLVDTNVRPLFFSWHPDTFHKSHQYQSFYCCAESP